MKRIDLTGSSEYLVILGYDEGAYECYSCQDEIEVFQVLTDRIKDEIDYNETYESTILEDEIIKAFIDYIKVHDVVTNPEILRGCWDILFADCWWYMVISRSGEVLYSWDWHQRGT